MDHPCDQDSAVLAIADIDTLKTACDMLRMEGCKVLACTNLKAAWSVLVATKPSIAVVDYHLPDSNIRQFLRAAKRAHPDLECIVLAEDAHVEEALRATQDLRARAVPKPLNTTIFTSVVRVCRKIGGRRRKLTLEQADGPQGKGTSGGV